MICPEAHPGAKDKKKKPVPPQFQIPTAPGATPKQKPTAAPRKEIDPNNINDPLQHKKVQTTMDQYGDDPPPPPSKSAAELLAQVQQEAAEAEVRGDDEEGEGGNEKEKRARSLKGKLHFHVYIIVKKTVMQNIDTEYMKRQLNLTGLFIDTNTQIDKERPVDWISLVNYAWKCSSCLKVDSSIYLTHKDEFGENGYPAFPRDDLPDHLWQQMKEVRLQHTDYIESPHIEEWERRYLALWRSAGASLKQWHPEEEAVPGGPTHSVIFSWDGHWELTRRATATANARYTWHSHLINYDADNLKEVLEIAGQFLSSNFTLTQKDNPEALFFMRVSDHMKANSLFLLTWRTSTTSSIAHIFKADTVLQDYDPITRKPTKDTWKPHNTALPYIGIEDFIYSNLYELAKSQHNNQLFSDLAKYSKKLHDLMEKGCALFPSCIINRQIIEVKSISPPQRGQSCFYDILTHEFIYDHICPRPLNASQSSFTSGGNSLSLSHVAASENRTSSLPCYAFSAVPINPAKILYPIEYLNSLAFAFPTRAPGTLEFEPETDTPTFPLSYKALFVLALQSLSYIVPMTKRPSPLYVGKPDTGKSSIPIAHLFGIIPTFYIGVIKTNDAKALAEVTPNKTLLVAEEMHVTKQQVRPMLNVGNQGKLTAVDRKHKEVAAGQISAAMVCNTQAPINIKTIFHLGKEGSETHEEVSEEKSRQNKFLYGKKWKEEPSKKKTVRKTPPEWKQVLEKECIELQVAFDRRFYRIDMERPFPYWMQIKGYDEKQSNPLTSFEILHFSNPVRRAIEVESGCIADIYSEDRKRLNSERIGFMLARLLPMELQQRTIHKNGISYPEVYINSDATSAPLYQVIYTQKDYEIERVFRLSEDAYKIYILYCHSIYFWDDNTIINFNTTIRPRK